MVQRMRIIRIRLIISHKKPTNNNAASCKCITDRIYEIFFKRKQNKYLFSGNVRI